MLLWLNPRVIVVLLTLGALFDLSNTHPPELMPQRAIFVCSILLLLFLAVFVFPLRKVLSAAALSGMIAALFAAWTATALALIAEARQLSPYIRMFHPSNPARTAFAVAAAIAFYLFFEASVRGFRKRDELRANGEPV